MAWSCLICERGRGHSGDCGLDAKDSDGPTWAPEEIKPAVPCRICGEPKGEGEFCPFCRERPEGVCWLCEAEIRRGNGKDLRPVWNPDGLLCRYHLNESRHPDRCATTFCERGSGHAGPHFGS